MTTAPSAMPTVHIGLPCVTMRTTKYTEVAINTQYTSASPYENCSKSAVRRAIGICSKKSMNEGDGVSVVPRSESPKRHHHWMELKCSSESAGTEATVRWNA